MQSTHTQTAEGFIPHFRHNGIDHPVAVFVRDSRKLPDARRTASGDLLYALPGGGYATAERLLNQEN